MRYDTGEYANSRLADTIVKLDGMPVRVLNVDDNKECNVHNLKDGMNLIVPLDKLDLTPIKLGYANINGVGAVYISRVPKREDWRQGLRPKNVTHGNFLDEAVVYLLCEAYPTRDEALHISSEVGMPQAFSREFGVDGEGTILYKGRAEVGEIEGGEAHLYDRFKYLEQLLEEYL